MKNLKKIFSGGISGRGRPPPAPTPNTATRRARGRKLPRRWDLGLGNRSRKSKLTTTPLVLDGNGMKFTANANHLTKHAVSPSHAYETSVVGSVHGVDVPLPSAWSA